MFDVLVVGQLQVLHLTDVAQTNDKLKQPSAVMQLH